MKLWIEEVKNNGSKNVRIIVVGNKIDLVDAENNSSEGECVNFE